MKILHINTFDNGGAAIAAIRLHKALLSQGINSSILFLTKTNNSIPNSFALVNEAKIKFGFMKRQYSRIKRRLFMKSSKRYINNRKLENRIQGFETFSFNPTDFDITKHKNYLEADIIHLHWVAGCLDYRFFRKNSKPVIWTLHDMNPFTGGCHYNTGCEKYRTECKNCPQLEGSINFNNSFYDQEYKNSFLKGESLVITAPSQWLRQCSSQSKLFGSFQNILIPYSLDVSVFKLQNKSFCRSVFNLPQDKKILLFVSADIENKRKGFSLLIEALSELDNTNLSIFAVGDRDDNISYQSNITFLGRISDERLMALVYSAADAFLMPSLEDNLPNVILESVACGTPVIAFNIGGIPDIIKTGFNGILARDVTPSCFAYSLNEFLIGRYKFDNREISDNARQNYSPIVQADRYLQLYQKMLDPDNF